jgi:F-type H+-transporting ATPase subunit alpha
LRLTEVLKQPQYSPLPVEKQVLILYAGGKGTLDDMEVDQCRQFEAELYKFVEASSPAILQEIREKKNLDDQLKAKIDAMLKEFKQRFIAQHKQAVATV